MGLRSTGATGRSGWPAVANLAGTTTLRVRSDRDREFYMEYWRGEHGRIVCQTPGLHQYRQHHFDPASSGIWPEVAGVETTISADERLDGVPETIFRNPVSALRSRLSSRAIFADERNLAAHTTFYGTPLGGFVDHTPRRGAVGAGGAGAVLLLRRRPDSGGRLRDDLRRSVGPALSRLDGLTELRTQVFLPWRRWTWNTPGVAHDNPPHLRYHAAVFIRFQDEDAMSAGITEAGSSQVGRTMAGLFRAVHAYRVAHTYHFTVDGRPDHPLVEPIEQDGART